MQKGTSKQYFRFRFEIAHHISNAETILDFLPCIPGQLLSIGGIGQNPHKRVFVFQNLLFRKIPIIQVLVFRLSARYQCTNCFVDQIALSTHICTDNGYPHRTGFIRRKRQTLFQTANQCNTCIPIKRPYFLLHASEIDRILQFHRKCSLLQFIFLLSASNNHKRNIRDVLSHLACNLEHHHRSLLRMQSRNKQHNRATLGNFQSPICDILPNLLRIKVFVIYADIKCLHTFRRSSEFLDHYSARCTIAHIGLFQNCAHHTARPRISTFAPVPFLHMHIIDYRQLRKVPSKPRQQIITMIRIRYQKNVRLSALDKIADELRVILWLHEIRQVKNFRRMFPESLRPHTLARYCRNYTYIKLLFIQSGDQIQIELIRAPHLQPGHNHCQPDFVVLRIYTTIPIR